MANNIRELFISLRTNEFDTFSDLIEKNNGDLNTRYGYTLLQMASMNGQVEFVRSLIQHGADIRFDGREDGDALYRAVFGCASNHELSDTPENEQKIKDLQKYYDTIKYLLESGADCNSVESYGNTSFIKACWYHYEGIKHIMKSIVELMLKHGANRKFKTQFGYTAEDVARKNSNDEIADCIRDYNDVPDSKGVQEQNI